MKALATAGYRVVTTDFARLPFGLRSRYTSAHYVVPGTDESVFESSLLDLVDRIRPDVLLPLGTRGTHAASRNRERVGAIANVPSLQAFLTAYDKRACIAECVTLGIPCPAVYAADEARRLLDRERGTLLVVKPDCDVGAARGVRYVSDRDALADAVRACDGLGCGALIQEYVPGGVDTMSTAILLFSRDSRLVAAFTTRKMRQWPETGGLTAESCSTADYQIVRQMLPFFEKWRWSGAAEVELKFDSRSGEHKVIEINPRFPGYLRFPLECGLDFATLAVRLALDGATVHAETFPAYTVGSRYVNPGLLLRTIVGQCRSGGVKARTCRDALREMTRAIPVMLGGLADPAPFLGRMLARNRSEPHAGTRLFLVGRQP